MGKKIKYWTKGVPVEDEAKKQVEQVSEMPFIHSHVAIMPDVHVGKGSTIGSVIPTVGAIIPAAVGVDLGCGMMALRLSLNANDLPENLKPIRLDIESAVPHGRTDNGGRNDKGAWSEIPPEVSFAWSKLKVDYNKFVEKHPKLKSFNTYQHLGTLGTGNHFIELCLDTAGSVWVMLHSGSRGVGNRIGTYFISKAKEEMANWHVKLDNKDLSYLVPQSKYYSDYIAAVHWAQEFAKVNREIMMDRVLGVLQEHLPPFFITDKAINCHHNYISFERHYGKNVCVTRKGAVSAQKGELGIIPGSMGAKSFIVRGKGERSSFCSCSHGAGRVMSRTAAKKLVTIDEHKKDMIGVESRLDKDILDETPKAYKNIDAVMKAQEDLVEIVYTLKQVLCVKG